MISSPLYARNGIAFRFRKRELVITRVSMRHRKVQAQGVMPEHIAVGGDSARVILIFAVLQKLRELKLPQPAAALAISGWFDLALTGKSYETNRDKDPAFPKEGVDWLALNFLSETRIGRILMQFLVTPISKKGVGIETRRDIFPNMLHSFQMMAGRAPEADDAIRRLAEWLRPKLGL